MLLRYMVYRKEGLVDADTLIGLLQALDKISAVRPALKVDDGVGGTKVVGTAGDFVGS